MWRQIEGRGFGMKTVALMKLGSENGFRQACCWGSNFNSTPLYFSSIKAGLETKISGIIF